MKKTITIDGKAVEFKCSAAIPLIYRVKFNRDLFLDMKHLADEMEANSEEASGIALSNLELFENVAWVMAKHADPEIPEPMEWLEQFEMFSIYEILPQILELWHMNTESLVETKKKSKRPAGK